MTSSMIVTRWVVLIASAGTLGVGCGETESGVGGNTNWFSMCALDEDCPEGSSCLCGTCSRECTSSDDCSDISSEAGCTDAPTDCAEAVSYCADKTGTRCSEDDDCPDAMTFVTEFFGERGICTHVCGSCGAQSQCVDDVPAYRGGSVGPFCLRPCSTQADCEAQGSECDTHTDLEEAYCF